MKEFTYLERISMQCARMSDNGDWSNEEERKKLADLVALAKQHGASDLVIKNAYKRASLYEKHWI